MTGGPYLLPSISQRDYCAASRDLGWRPANLRGAELSAVKELRKDPQLHLGWGSNKNNRGCSGTNSLLRRLFGQVRGEWGPAMTDESYEQKLAELDDLINNPNVPLCPARIWQLMGEISGHVGLMTNLDQERQPVAVE